MIDEDFSWTLRRVALWPIAAMLLLGLMLLGLIHFLLSSANWVEHTDRVIAQTYTVESLLLEMEGGLRGYQATGDAAFLNPFERDGPQVEAASRTLAQLVSDNPEQSETVRSLQTAIAQWRGFARDMLERLRSGTGAGDLAFNANGRQHMETARARASELIAGEQMLRLQRVQTLDRVRTGLLASIALAVLLLGPAGALWVRRLLKRVTSSHREVAERVTRQADELRVTVRSIGDAVIATDAKGHVSLLNPVAEQLTGWSTGEAAGKRLEEVFVIFNEQTGKMAENPVARVLREQKVVGLANHTVLRARDGREIPIDDSAAPIRGDAGEVQGVILVFHDVTEARAVQRQIRESGERLQAALTGSGAGTFRWNILTNALEWDENLDRLFGLPPGETIRSLENFIATVHPDDRERVIRQCERCAREGVDFDMEFRVIWPDASVHWLHDRGKTFCDDNGKPLHMSGACVDITARKRADEALAEARMRLDATLSASEIGTWVWDVENDRVTADKNLARFFSVTPDDAAGGPVEHYNRAIHPEDRAKVQAATAEALESESGEFDLDYRLVQPDGGPRWVAARGKVERNATGKPVRFPGVVIDITARKEAEAARRESDADLRLLLDSTAEAFYAIDREGNTTLCNAAFLRMLGFEREGEVLGRKLHDVIHHSHPDGSYYPVGDCPIYCAAQTGQAAHIDNELFFRLDRSSFPVEYWSYPILRDGELQGAITSFIDITERKRTEEALRESERRLRFMAESMPQKIFTAKSNGDVDYFNRQWLEFTGLSFEQIRDWGWLHIIHPEDLDENIRRWQHSINTGEPFYLEHRFLRVDGQYRWHVSRAVPMRDAAGKVLMWIGSNTDIEEVRQAQEKAERASRAKDEFLAALSHELRTPLTPVLMTAATLRNEERLPQDVRDQLAMMQRNIELEARLIDDLLDLTRISHGKLQLRPQPCDVHSLVALAVEMVRSEASRKRQTLEVDLAAVRSQLHCDPARIQQVFWNLLKNAVKFTPEAGQLSVTSRDTDDRLTLEIRDTGVGIPADALERIFLPFEQAAESSTDHRFGGLGLGLSISKAILDLHGGNIEAESPGIGRGATFRVNLPAVENALGATPGNASDAETGERRRTRGVRLPALRLLLVEDHEPTLAVLEHLLSRAGHQVTSAMSVAGGLEAAATVENLEAVISDLGLPDGTGFELMQQLHERYGLRGIALSGYGMDEDLRRSSAAGFSTHLTKPIDFAQLEQAIADLMADTPKP